MMDKLRHPSPRARLWIGWSIVAVAMLYIFLTARQQDRDLIPKFHDEHMHLLQMRMLAHGRLWMPAHPLADFFDSFHVLVTPVYASIYFPGTALLYLPTVWLNLPHWVMPLLLAGLTVGLMYRVVTELLDGVSGMLAALMLLSLQMFRFVAMLVISHEVIIFLGLLLIWSYLRWRFARSLGWAAAMGAIAGWMAITRPLDAIAYAAPVAVAVLVALGELSMKRRLAVVAVACAAAAPLIALQIALNVGVTGNPLKTPYQLYAEQDSTNLAIGFHEADAEVELRSVVEQKREFYRDFLLPTIRSHQPRNLPRIWWRERLPLLVQETLPSLLLLPLVALSIFDVRRQARVMLWAVLPLYLALYCLFPFLLPHYVVVAAPPMVLAVLMGKRAVESFFSAARQRVEVILTVAVAALTLISFPQFDREAIDDGYLMPTMWFSYKILPQQVQPPAIVLFRYAPGDNFNEEPVYNIDALWPDHAPIIRAHDLGPERNRELFEYYAARQPRRMVYHFNRQTRTLTKLGNVAELVRQLHQRGPSSSGPM